MVEFRPAGAGDEKHWRALWQEVFGDGDALLDCFSRCCPAEEILLLWEGGRLCSMLALPPVELALPQGGTATGAYVYALATDPAARGKGYGRLLLRETDDYLRKKGVDCVTVVPAEDSLYQFFGTAGFLPRLAHQRLTLAVGDLPAAAAGDGVEPLAPEVYNDLRNKLLEGVRAVRYPDRLLAFQQGLSCLPDGGLYRLTLAGEEGCAAAEWGVGGLVVKELLLPAELGAGAATLAARQRDMVKAAAASLTAHLATPPSVCTVALRGPVGTLPKGVLCPFGMVKRLTTACGDAWGDGVSGYLGLGFD